MKTNGSHRGFAGSAISAFRFLVDDLGFRLTRQESTLVRFESSTVFVNVYHGRSSYELGVEIGPLANGRGPEEKFMLGDILEAAGQPAALAFREATTVADVDKGLRELSALTQRYGHSALRGDRATYEPLRATQARLSREFLLKHRIGKARVDSEKAFQNGDYETVVRLLKPIETYLSETDRERLRHAERQSAH